MEQMDLFAVVRIPLYTKQYSLVAEALIDATDAPLILPFRWAIYERVEAMRIGTLADRRAHTGLF